MVQNRRRLSGTVEMAVKCLTGCCPVPTISSVPRISTSNSSSSGVNVLLLIFGIGIIICRFGIYIYRCYRCCRIVRFSSHNEDYASQKNIHFLNDTYFQLPCRQQDSNDQLGQPTTYPNRRPNPTTPPPIISSSRLPSGNPYPSQPRYGFRTHEDLSQ
jgi:hypothetical protein